MLQQLWNDEHGAVVSPEMCVIGAILVIGLLTGISALQVNLVSELGDVGAAIQAMELTPRIVEDDEDDVAPSSMPLTAADVMGN
jgi:Flp pilus assembly pilin Flp